MPPFVICMLNVNASWHGWRLPWPSFFLMAVSDALDGFLARRLGEATPLGRYLDPIGDKLLITSAVILLAIESTALPGYRLPSWVPVIAIGKDVLTVIGFALVYATTGQFFVQPRTLGKACTLVQLMMVAYALGRPGPAAAGAARLAGDVVGGERFRGRRTGGLRPRGEPIRRGTTCPHRGMTL